MKLLRMAQEASIAVLVYKILQNTMLIDNSRMNKTMHKVLAHLKN